MNNEIEAVVLLLLFQHVLASCLGVFFCLFVLFFSISYLPLHHSCCQNYAFSLSSPKSRLCSRQTFHMLVLCNCL